LLVASLIPEKKVRLSSQWFLLGKTALLNGVLIWALPTQSVPVMMLPNRKGFHATIAFHQKLIAN
jgi:hypothetical protein